MIHIKHVRIISNQFYRFNFYLYQAGPRYSYLILKIKKYWQCQVIKNVPSMFIHSKHQALKNSTQLFQLNEPLSYFFF